MPVTRLGDQCCRCQRRPATRDGHCAVCHALHGTAADAGELAQIAWLETLADLPTVVPPSHRGRST